MKNQKDRDIYPNVDLYSASLYYMLKIPMDLNTPIFAISRVADGQHMLLKKSLPAAPKPAFTDQKQSMLESIADRKVVNIKH